MDILKKMFKQNNAENEHSRDKSTPKDEFRKPQWFEETETDDELFDDDRKFPFQVFTNPMELQKHFERQMQQILESFIIDESGPVEKNLKEEFLKPGFESAILKEFKKQNKQYFDTDLDDEIFSDQLHSLIQSFVGGETFKQLPQIIQDSPNGNILPRNDNKVRGRSTPKMTDEEIIMGRIHGTLDNENQERRKSAPRYRPDFMNPMAPIVPRSSNPFNGSPFDGNFQGPKMFSQSIMTKTVRKPDGTYETTKIVQDSQGNKTTTITRQKEDGKQETITLSAGDDAKEKDLGSTKEAKTKESTSSQQSQLLKFERNVYVSKDGYALPKNLW